MYLFVYGTLKKGFCNSYLLNGQEFIKEASTDNDYKMVDFKGMYPYLFNEDGGFKIKGEIYKVSDNCLDELDRFEGAPDFYYRDTIVADGINCECYFINETYKRGECIDEFVK